MCQAFADADFRLGGGHARPALTWYVHDVVAPMLAGAYTDQVGRELFAVAAWLCDVAGFMCFDSGRQGLGQRYFISGLRMAKVSGDQAIGAHILTDMSMQAQFQRHPHGAVALADAAVSAAKESGSASTQARCHAIRARALALRGDASGSDQALNQAERALDRADPWREPSWLAFYTPRQLAAESATPLRNRPGPAGNVMPPTPAPPASGAATSWSPTRHATCGPGRALAGTLSRRAVLRGVPRRSAA
jgi:hypothetical protein